MSRVGKKTIVIPDTVNVTIDEDDVVIIKGPKGELSIKIDKKVQVSIDNNKINVSTDSSEKENREKHGLYQALITNMIIGVTEGYTKDLVLVGIGYRVQLKGKDLNFSLGYSHPVSFKAPEGINFNVVGQDKLNIQGIDKQKIGEVCAQIMNLRQKDPYKGKGIHPAGVTIKTKPGKTVKK